MHYVPLSFAWFCDNSVLFNWLAVLEPHGSIKIVLLMPGKFWKFVVFAFTMPKKVFKLYSYYISIVNGSNNNVIWKTDTYGFFCTVVLFRKYKRIFGWAYISDWWCLSILFSDILRLISKICQTSCYTWCYVL